MSPHVIIITLTALRKLATCGEPEVSKEAKGALVRLEVTSHGAADVGKTGSNDGSTFIFEHCLYISRKLAHTHSRTHTAYNIIKLDKIILMF